ncbi:hypothetical protein ACSBR1_011906 [Camellia fascicularis]
MLFFHLLSFYFLPFLFFILFLFIFFSLTTFTKKPYKNPPPSPPKLPISGNLHLLGSLPHHSLRSLSQKHGPLMLLHLGNVPVLVVSSSIAAREIMKTHDQIFSSRPKLSIIGRLTYGFKDMAFSPYGEYWRQVRSICVLHLLSNKMVQSVRNVREEETALMIEKIKHFSSSSSLFSSSVNLSDMFAKLTNDIVCRVALGRRYSGGEREGRRFKELFTALMELFVVFNVGDYIPWLGWLNRFNGLDGKVKKYAKEMDDFLEEVLEDHIVGGNRSEGKQDFVDILLEIQRENKDGSSPVHRDTIKAVSMDMFGAGTDTVFTTIEWTMAELLRHPQIMNKLQNEVREIARGKLNTTEDDLKTMHYLKAVIKESLRMHPPVPLLVPRESIQDAKVMGYDIAAGTQVIVNAWAIGRDPLSWEDPEEFRPERFLNSSIDFKGHDFELIPFGAGRRGCPGTQFATNVIELALASVVHKFDFSLPNGAIGDDLDMTEVDGITVHKKIPLIVVPTPYSC